MTPSMLVISCSKIRTGAKTGWHAVVLLVVLLIAAWSPSGCSVEPMTLQSGRGTGIAETNVVPDELLVKFKEGTTSGRIDVINRDLHGETIQVLAEGRLYHLRFPAGTNIEALRQTYERLPEVEYAEANYRVKAQ